MEGWIKLHRKTMENPLFDDGRFLALFVTLLMMATHKERRTRVDGETVTLKPGQLVTGRKALATKLGFSEGFIQRTLRSLESDQVIDQVMNSKSRTITICNWELYQNCDQVSEQQVISKRSGTDQVVITKQERKNVKNVKNGKKKKPVFDPTGKKKFEDHVYLDEKQITRVTRYYADRGLEKEDLLEAIRELDKWFSDNPKKRAQRTDDAKALMGWPLDRAIERRKKLLQLKLQEERNYGNNK